MQSLHRVEKSPPSYGTGGITAGDLSTQSIIGAFSICPIPTCISARNDDVGPRPSRHFDRSEAEWRNLTPQMTEKLSRALRHFDESEAEWRNLTPQMTEKLSRALRHFDESEAEWRNLLPLMVRAALRQEISRLRVSWERFPSAPYRHAAPLEMTMGRPLTVMEPK